jgi:hypothetical protein
MAGFHMEGGLDPNESFIDSYMAYTAKQESPWAFHFWTATTILAATMGRKCYFNKGYYRLYPNFFTVLVAGSATCRKSTAIGLGVELLRGRDITLESGIEIVKEIEGVKVINGKVSPEKFVREIAESAPASDDLEGNRPPAILVHASELSVFLTKQAYGESLIHILTDLYDCPNTWEYKTKNAGSDKLRDLFLCILAGTTPTGIAKGIPESALHEGFASRILFVYEPTTDRRNALPELSEEEIEAKERVIKLLERRARLEGEFTLTPSARDWYMAWYEDYMNGYAAEKRLEGMYGRRHDHVLRVGMVLAGSYGQMEIEVEQLIAADDALTYIESKASGAFVEIGSTDITTNYNRMLSCVRALRIIGHSYLLKKMHPVTAKEFAGMIETAIEAKYIKRNENKLWQYVWIGDDIIS